MNGTVVDQSAVPHLHQKRVIKIVFIVLLLGITIANFLSAHEVANSFLFRTLGQVNQILADGHMSMTDLNNPGYHTIIAFLQLTLGVEGAHLVMLPIGMVIAPLLFYVFTRVVFGSEVVAICCMAYMVAYIAETVWFNIYAYVWARSLFFLAAALLVALFLSPTMQIDSRFKTVCIILITTLPLLHYTSIGWLIVILGIFVILATIDQRSWRNKATVLLLLSSVLFLITTRIIETAFIPALVAQTTETGGIDTVSNFVDLITAMFAGEAVAEDYRISRSTPIYSQIRLVISLLFAGLIAIGTIVASWQFIKQWRNPNSDISYSIYLFFALVVLAAVHALVYGIVFSISPQAVILLGPVFGVLVLYQLGVQPRYITVFLGITLTLATISLMLRLGLFSDQLLRYSLVRPGGEWFRDYALAPGRDTSILASIHLRNYYQYIVARDMLSFVYFNTDLYAAMVGEGGSIAGEADYLVIDPASREDAVAGPSIRVEYQPVGWHETAIETNSEMNRVYSDGNSDIYKISD